MFQIKIVICLRIFTWPFYNTSFSSTLELFEIPNLYNKQLLIIILIIINNILIANSHICKFHKKFVSWPFLQIKIVLLGLTCRFIIQQI